MKVCPSCHHRFESGGWRCSECGFSAEHRDGLAVLAREAGANGAFSPEEFGALEMVEQESFWFRARNELIVWAATSLFPTPSSVLEVGCGNGYVLAALEAALPNAELVGMELGSAGLDVARKRLRRASLIQADARAIPFEAEFDLACAFDVIEHIEADEAALEQMRSCLRPGGGLLLTVPQHRWLWAPVDEYSGHFRRYTRKELVAKVRRAGFQERLVTSFMTSALPVMGVSRLASRLRPGKYDPGGEHRQAERVSGILGKLMSLDLRLIRRGNSLPAGGSLLLAAMKGS
jgi:SAM-dependent methyltransferase